jgi:hypothetical protein
MNERLILGASEVESGKYQTAGVYGGYIYISDDYGATWSQKGFSANWIPLACNK